MPSGVSYGAGCLSWGLRTASLLGAMLAVLVAVVSTAGATVEAIQPSSGQVVQGGAVSATVYADSTASCLTATASDPALVVSFEGVTTACGSGSPWTATMTVAASAVAPVGDHAVTVRELDPLGVLVHSRIWPVTVLAPSTTTTTTLPDTSTLPVPTSSTTTSSTTTTSTVPAATSTTTTTVARSSTTLPPQGGGSDSGGDGKGPLQTGAAALPQTTSTSSTTLERGASGAAVVDQQPFEGTSLSTALGQVLALSMPPLVAEAIISPLLVAEILIRAILESVGALTVPLVLLAGYGGWLLWRWSPFQILTGRSGDDGPGDPE